MDTRLSRQDTRIAQKLPVLLTTAHRPPLPQGARSASGHRGGAASSTFCKRGCTAHGPLCWPPSTRKGTLRPTACWGTGDLLTAECAPLHRQIAVCPSGRPPADGCLICPGARCCQQLFSRVGAGREARNGLRNGLRWLFTAAACPPSAPGSAPCHARDLGSSTPPAGQA